MLTQILINSILSGFILSLVALGFNIIFNATKVFHIAHGAMYVGSIYGVYYLNGLFKQIMTYEFSITLSIVFSLFLIVILIFFIEYLVYRPLYQKKISSAISLISSLGVYFLIINIITFFLGNESIALNNNYSIIVSNKYFRLTTTELMILIIGSMLIYIVAFFSKTKIYTHIRAISDDYIIAEKFGINIQRTRFIALLVGTLLVGSAGIMQGYEIAIDPNVGLPITLAASVAVIIGGINSLKGTVISCFIIAIIENFSVKFLSAKWTDALTYILLIVVLIFYKQGLIAVKQRIEIR